MACPGWDAEEEEPAPWIGDYEGGFEDEEDGFEEEEESEEALLDDEYEYEEESAEEEDEDELEAMIEEGEALIEEGEYASALQLFREAVERFPESPTAQYHVGQTSLMLFTDGVTADENWRDDDELVAYQEEAASAFEAALAMDDEFYPALNGQGALYMLLDNSAAATECWERSLDINPDQVEIQEALESAQDPSEDEE
ncbi:tetratricopeptide repeat protein [Candidatus Poribacteria bacterium]|nr:tetratricopeptide repeat protein [Candidatus Poribacteria bacterium]